VIISFFSNHDEWLVSVILNSLLIISVHRVPLLTKKGYFHAGVLGTILWACIGWHAWLSVVSYLLLGFLVTKLGYKQKSLRGIAESRGGKRGPENVWGSAATGAILALLFKVSNDTYSNLILIAFAASFAAKLGDTFGSEIGKRWGANPVLITSLHPVKPGTDGAISLQGTIASFIGSTLMSFVMALLSVIPFGYPFIIVSTSGFIATLFESIIGAVFQARFKYLTNEVVNFIQTTISSIIAISIFLLVV